MIALIATICISTGFCVLMLTWGVCRCIDRYFDRLTSAELQIASRIRELEERGEMED